MEVLRTGLFALAALDTIGRFRFFAARMYIIIVVRIPVVIELLGVHHREQVGDRDVFRAARGAVPTGCTGDQVHRFEYFLYLADRRQFLFR